MYHYFIFGLQFESELEIAELPELHIQSVDVTIGIDHVSDHLDQVTTSGVLFESNGKEFLLRLPNVGKFLVKNGSQILVDPKPNATPEEIRLFLQGSVFGALMHQRGFLPLHGSAVEIPGGAMLILGHSASGKSTLTASLTQTGFPFIADDIAAIKEGPSGQCFVFRGIPHIKLWEDVRERLFPDGSYQKVRPQIEKFRIPVPRMDESDDPIRIETIVCLTTKNMAGISHQLLKGAEKIPVLRNHIFRDQIVAGSAMLANHFSLLEKLARQVRLYNLERPTDPLNIETLAAYTKTHIINSKRNG
jgi:hypothetical protein